MIFILDRFDRLWRCVVPCFQEGLQICLARLVRLLGHFAPKQLVSQPNAIGINDIALAIFGDLLDPTVAVIFFSVACDVFD